jgi:transmembrane sensor
MSDDHEAPDRDGRVRINEEAARWFARMRGPDAEHSGAAFEEWLSRSGLHREAYNRVAEVFALGKSLKAAETPARSSASRRPVLAMSLLATCLAAVAGFVLLAPQPGARLPSPEQGRPRVADNGPHFVVQPGDVRTLRLMDGSVVTLDSGAVLDVRFDGIRRSLDLRAGRARFDVAHERRPFVVEAGGSWVTARGTMFDVSVLDGRMLKVALYRGTVDVLSRSSNSAPMSTTRLEAGRQLAFGTSSGPAAVPISRHQIDWPQAFVDYDHAPLATVVEAANLYGLKPIRLVTPDLGALRVSGRFRLSDTDHLADQLAAVFALRVDRSGFDEIRLGEPDGTPQ